MLTRPTGKKSSGDSGRVLINSNISHMISKDALDNRSKRVLAAGLVPVGLRCVLIDERTMDFGKTLAAPVRSIERERKKGSRSVSLVPPCTDG